jgi:cell division protein FtsI/penicillin-binding protein 2
LALASYPVYAYDRFSADYGDLVRDARRTPTRFRAVNGLYPPGSTCKAITLVGALAEHETTPHERIHCTGHLLPNRPHMFRCWIYNDFGTTHDASRNSAGLNGAEAIQNSCNIYFFRTGARLGCERLCHWFKRFGLGRTQGTGLIEESAGILPTRERLGRPYQPSDAWNFAIGQGEVTATPLQVANVCATIAAGHWAPVSILRAASDEAATRLHGEPDFDPAALRELRKGMWRVVNERLGTAYSRRLKRDDYVLCGKTGTAQAVPQPTEYRYTFEWPDGRREVVHAYLESDARRTAIAKWGGDPERVGKHTSRRYPDLLRGELSSHGWFMGYTQRADVPPGAAPRGRVYAIAVVIEYGLSGSRAAGPVATTLAEYVLEHAE